MADKDKNDNEDNKKKMVEKKANDDFEELIDAAKRIRKIQLNNSRRSNS